MTRRDQSGSGQWPSGPTDEFLLAQALEACLRADREAPGSAEQIIARVAALDIGKAELVCCVRVPTENGSRKRLQEVSTHSTMTRSLIGLANHLVELRVERVVMEATSDYVRHEGA